MANYEERCGNVRVRVMRQGRKFTKTFSTRALAEQWADRMEHRAAGMPMLRAALEDHRIAMCLPKRQREAIKRANYSAHEILECAFPVDMVSGVYFLIRDGEIFYVGQTMNLFDRLRKHNASSRKFDSFSFIPCPQDQLDALESAYIAMLLPSGNGTL